MNFDLLIAGTIWLVLLGPVVYRWLKRWLAVQQRERAIQTKLAGRSAKTLIADSPFEYGHWQGEDGYRIMDNRREPPFIGFASSVEDAEAQILTLIFTDQA